MDTSKEYIKMCEEAKEIQKSIVLNVQHNFYGDINMCSTLQKTIWLPRQDQLQEMLLEDPDNRFETSICYITLVCQFARFCGIEDEDAEGRSNVDIRKESLEVLWLAFVMAEKYSKEWNGDKWIKADDINFGKIKRLLPWEVG